MAASVSVSGLVLVPVSGLALIRSTLLLALLLPDVKAIVAVSGWRTSAAPASPSPGRRLMASLGILPPSRSALATIRPQAMANSMGSQAGAWIARSDEDRLAGGAGGFIGEPGKVGNDTGTARRLLL